MAGGAVRSRISRAGGNLGKERKESRGLRSLGGVGVCSIFDCASVCARPEKVWLLGKMRNLRLWPFSSTVGNPDQLPPDLLCSTHWKLMTVATVEAF
jgi:hypothetical protein